MSCDPLATFKKDPAARLDYVLDWSVWLGADTISASTWAITPTSTTTPLEESGAPYAPSFTDTSTRVFLEGGKVGVTYTVTNHITTDGGLIDERSFEVTVSER
jgi:hypothetical protein